MPVKLDGFDATRIIKADYSTSNIPIIALTSLAMSGDKERTIEAGCDGYLTKPVDIHELLNIVLKYAGAKI
jgi:two-component system, cell cycle response regulator DivK